MTRNLLLLAALCLLALGARRVGIGFGVPLLEESDANIPKHAQMLRRGRDAQRKKSPDNVQYPGFLAALVSLVPPRKLVDRGGATLEQHLWKARGTSVQARGVVALLSLLAIPATWLLARRFSSDRWALLAAAIPATSLLFLNFSQQARPHAALTALMTWTVLAALWMRRRPSWLSHAVVGVLAALTAGTLHSGFIVCLPIAMAWILREPDPGGGRRLPLSLARAFLTLALIGSALPLFYPFLFERELMDRDGVFRSWQGGVRLGEHELTLSMFDGSGFASMVRVLWNWEPLLLGLLILASAVWLVSRRWDLDVALRAPRGEVPVLLAFIVPYALLLGVYSRTYERFLLPLLPFLACFVAWAAAAAAARLGGRSKKVLAGVLVALLALPGYASARFAWLRSRPDTLELAGDWIRTHVDLETPVFITPPIDLPLGRTEETLWREERRPSTPLFSPWSKYQSRLPEDQRPAPVYAIRWLAWIPGTKGVNEVDRLDAMLDAFGPGIYVLQATERSEHPLITIREGVTARGALEVRLSPDPDPWLTNWPLFDQDEQHGDQPHVFLRVLRARAVGPVVEVYRID